MLLSDILDLNESRTSSLLDQANLQAARFDRDVRMTAILMYHRGRRYVADSLVALQHFALDGNIKEPIRRVICTFVDEIMETTTIESTLASPISKLLATLDDLKKKELSWSMDTDGGDCDNRKSRDIATRLKTLSYADNGANAETLIQTHVAHLMNARKDVATTIWASVRYRHPTSVETVLLIGKIRQIDMNDAVAFSLVTAFLAAEATPPYENSESSPKISDEYVADVERELILQPWLVRELQTIICFRWAVYLRNEIGRAASPLTVTDDHIQQLVRASITQGYERFDFPSANRLSGQLIRIYTNL